MSTCRSSGSGRVNSSHASQKAAALWESLSAAGIGRAYHRRSLYEVGHDDLTLWAQTPSLSIPGGRGWTLIGDDKAYDALMLLARACHIQGYRAFVLTLRQLVKRLEHDTGMEEVHAAQVLCITGFYDVYQGTDAPLRGWQVQDVESLLLDRLDNGGSICVQSARPLRGDGVWWSNTLLRRLKAVNREATIT
jgi:hypothetical protein